MVNEIDFEFFQIPPEIFHNKDKNSILTNVFTWLISSENNWNAVKGNISELIKLLQSRYNYSKDHFTRVFSQIAEKIYLENFFAEYVKILYISELKGLYRQFCGENLNSKFDAYIDILKRISNLNARFMKIRKSSLLRTKEKIRLEAESILQEKKEDHTLLWILGSISAMLGIYQDAIMYYKRVMVISSSNTEYIKSLYNLISILMSLEDYSTIETIMHDQRKEIEIRQTKNIDWVLNEFKTLSENYKSKTGKNLIF